MSISQSNQLNCYRIEYIPYMTHKIPIKTFASNALPRNRNNRAELKLKQRKEIPTNQSVSQSVSQSVGQSISHLVRRTAQVLKSLLHCERRTFAMANIV